MFDFVYKVVYKAKRAHVILDTLNCLGSGELATSVSVQLPNKALFETKEAKPK